MHLQWQTGKEILKSLNFHSHFYRGIENGGRGIEGEFIISSITNKHVLKRPDTMMAHWWNTP